jgi:hypothetical protein
MMRALVFDCTLQELLKRLLRVREKSHWKPLAFQQARPETDESTSSAGSLGLGLRLPWLSQE